MGRRHAARARPAAVLPGGPVNWDLAKNVARQTVAPRATRRVMRRASAAQVVEAVRLADLWLDEATALPPARPPRRPGAGRSGSRRPCRSGSELCDPVAAQASSRWAATLGERRGLPRGDAGRWPGPLHRHDARRWAARCSAARSARRSARWPARWSAPPTSACRSRRRARPRCCPADVAAFGRRARRRRRRGAALPRAARGRAPAAVRARAVAARAPVRRGRGLRQRHHGRHRARSRRSCAGSTRPTPRRCRRRCGGGLFEPEDTPAQKAALARLETALALVEGWVDDGGRRGREPTRCRRAAALRETVRRRRATGGPAEQTFATLVGLELRPRRLREAAALWAALTEARGVDGRDALWAHPDLLPTADDLDDPDGVRARSARIRYLGPGEPGGPRSGEHGPEEPGRGRLTPDNYSARPPAHSMIS